MAVATGWMYQQSLSRSFLLQPPNPDDKVPFGVAALSSGLRSRVQSACAEIKTIKHNSKFKSLAKLGKYPLNVEITAL